MKKYIAANGELVICMENLDEINNPFHSGELIGKDFLTIYSHTGSEIIEDIEPDEAEAILNMRSVTLYSDHPSSLHEKSGPFVVINIKITQLT